MSTRRSASLARRYPHRIEVPFLLFASGILLTLGLTMPVLETRAFFFWRDEYSIYMNVVSLNRDGREVAAMILAVCSIIYPICKLLMLGWLWLVPFPYRWRWRFIRVLRLLGRWSMLDVFVVTAIVLGSMTIGPLQATPRTGLFLYAGGIVALMVVSLSMDSLARRSARYS